MHDDGAEVGALVARAIAGDRGGYDALVDRFGRLVWHIARTYGLGPDDAADASQMVWLRFVEQLEHIREPSRAGAWLATTTRHECLAILRRRARTTPVDLFAIAAADGLHQEEAVGSERLEATDRAEAVRRAFADLPERCRALLGLLSQDPPASYDEVSAALDVPVGTIGPTRQRCLKRLRRHPAIAGIAHR
ncbi:MAG: RNA polymerase sigma factor [Acidimicrobiia bacterium]